MFDKKIFSTCALTAIWLIEATAAIGQEELPPNTWLAVRLDWKQALAEVADDAQWQTGDGYSDNVLRSKTGELLIRTGIVSKKLGLSP